MCIPPSLTVLLLDDSHSFSYRSDPEKGLQYVRDLLKAGDVLDHDVTSAVVHTLGKAGRIDEIIEFLDGCNLEVEADHFIFRDALR